MGFQPGNDLGKGRPQGARNKSSYDLRERLKARGDRDPAEFLSEIISNENEPKELRIAASGVLMPYYHSKLGATPVLPPPQYVEEAISLPRPDTIRQAYENIAYLTEMKSLGKLDIATADSLINDQKVILYALIDEAKLLAAQGGSPEQVIRIEGGMDHSPWGGDNIIMPKLNGHEIDLQVTPAISSPDQPPVDDQTASRPSNPEV
jgi:hypothetical protein